MTFTEITRTMLGCMDFFELRKTAAKYDVAFQGVRRQQLLKELEKKIVLKNVLKANAAKKAKSAKKPMGAVSAKPKLESNTQKKVAASINNFSSRAGFTRSHTR